MTHAKDFLNWLVTEPALAGTDVLEKILKQIYATEFTRRRGRKPLPWESVLRRFSKMMGGPKTYKWVYKGGRRRRLRVYRIPLPQQLVQAPERQSEVVA